MKWKASLFLKRLIFAVISYVLIPELLSVEPLWAQMPMKRKKDDKAANDQGISIRYDQQDGAGDDEESPVYVAPIEHAFKNPTLVSGLESGADELNRSFESLMDSIFYGIMDNEFRFTLTERSWFAASLKRDVFSTPSGAYVVIDRVGIGPSYAREIVNIQNIPLSIGADGRTEVLQIYLRTDGMRVAEQKDLPTWRRWANNWFGLLPLLSAILPPSFNQNELYDPIRQLETPFVFPFDVDAVEKMPIGSIRSYGLTGGVRFPIGLDGILPGSLQDEVGKAGGLAFSVPYTLFLQGEHHVNVLRRDKNTVWVGVNNLVRTGHGLSPTLGNRLHILRGAFAASMRGWKWIWAGVPFALLPIDIDFEQAVANLYDQVYEYDLRNPRAQEAYKAAVRGDFVESRMRWLDYVEKKQETGVRFHFQRAQDRKETGIRNGPNVAVYRTERTRQRSSAEIEITDQEGKFYVLEGRMDVADKKWDILVGEQQTQYLGSAELKVRRVVPKQEEKVESALDKPVEYTYAFEAGPEPYSLNISISIQDRYVDVDEYNAYIEQVRYITHLPLESVPRFSLRDPERVREYRQRSYFVEPDRDMRSIHVMPTYLGSLGAQASLGFSTAELDRITNASDDEMWVAFAKAFGVDPTDWSTAEKRASFWHQTNWFKSFFLYPTKLINIRLPEVDLIKEASNGVSQLIAIRTMSEPLDKLEAFYGLFDCEHPAQLIRTLLNLSQLPQVSRRVSFSANAKGPASPEVKEIYARFNGKTFKAGPPFATPSRYARAQKTLAAFYLDQPREAEMKPHIANVNVRTKSLRPQREERKSKERSLRKQKQTSDSNMLSVTQLDKHVFVTVTTVGVPMGQNVKIYLRVEEAGKLKLGKLALAEQVIDLLPVTSAKVSADQAKTSQKDSGIKEEGKPRGGKNKEANVYQFFLTGPQSPVHSQRLDSSVEEGDEYRVTMTVSSDGQVWSDERVLEFQFAKGLLSRIE